MSKIRRNESTTEGARFWKSVTEASAEAQGWPAWKRAGINVSPTRADTASRAQKSSKKSPGASSTGT